MAVRESMAELRQKREELRKQILEQAKSAFNEEAKGLFAQFPDMESFSWSQYTPYWNDGDECVFSAHSDYPTITTQDGEFDEDSYYSENDPSPTALCYRAVVEFLGQFGTEEYRDMFGDHVCITVFADRVEVDEHKHD